MQVAPNIHRVEAPLGERCVCVYVLVGSNGVLLVDTGIAATPAETIEPYLNEIGLGWSDLRFVLTTHADVDHMGGNGSVRALAENALFICHRADAAMVEDVELMITDRYCEFAASHGIEENAEARTWFRANAEPATIDLRLAGEATLDLGSWPLEIIATPGHSRGHLSVWDSQSGTAIIADAVLADAVPTRDGVHSLAPTYRHVDDYLQTIERLSALPISTLCTSHFPILRQHEVEAFLAKSSAFADRLEDAVRASLRQGDQSTAELLETVGARVATWPRSAALSLAYPLVGHLEQLRSRDEVSSSARDGVLRWTCGRGGGRSG